MAPNANKNLTQALTIVNQTDNLHDLIEDKKADIVCFSTPNIRVGLWHRLKAKLVICEERFSLGFRIHMGILPPMNDSHV